MADSIPNLVPPLASFLAEEMDARGWRASDVAARLSGYCDENLVFVNLLLAVQDDWLLLTPESLGPLADAFGVSAQLFIGMHDQWLQEPDRRQPFECPEHLLNGLWFPGNDHH